MRIVKRISLIFVLAIFSLACFFPLGVKADWHYAGVVLSNIEITMSVQVLPWQGSEQLPSDVVGADHQQLIDSILNGTYTNSDGSVTQIGLNNPNSYISNEINNRVNGNFLFRSDVLGSMDYWERSDIEKFFNTETSGLSFVLYFPQGSADTYYLYTTSVDLGEQSNNPNIPIGEKIYPVYQTELKKNEEGKWEAVQTKTGHAESAYYQNPITGSWLVKYPSLDPNSWIEQELGDSFDSAIYAFVGQSPTAYCKDASTLKYYKITTSSAATITVSSQENAHKIKVYNSQRALVNANGGAQGTNNVSFRSARNSTYYIEVSGGQSITFAIN